MTAARTPGRTGIAVRLLVAMALVLVSAALAAGLVAAAVGPVLFHQHMRDAEQEPGTTVEHAERAFASASTVTLTVALVAAALTALVACTVLARRIGSSLGTLSSAAGQVSAGRFDIRLQRPRIGVEFDELADAFNAMAGRLSRDEELRHRLMTDVAHELRTPVATIVAYLDALEDGVQELTPQTVEVLRTQAARLTRLSSDLGAVTQAESGVLVLHPRPASAADLVQATVAGAAARARQVGVSLHGEVEPALPDLTVDTERIGQVLANLVDNAVRHTPAGGQVLLHARRTPEGVRLSVVDTGEGITVEHLPHVFERFYRVDTARDRAHGGSGVGLAIAKALTEAHGGTITVHSAGTGHGTQFAVDLPVPAQP